MLVRLKKKKKRIYKIITRICPKQKFRDGFPSIRQWLLIIEYAGP